MFTYNDFFCGCGGFGLGFKQAGFKTVGAWDFDKYAVQSYKENVDGIVAQTDIRNMKIDDIPKADVWSFGFPCQDLSVAGKKKGMILKCNQCGHTWKVEGENYQKCPNCGCMENHSESRSGLFFEMMRLLKEAREESPDKLPSVIVAENVKALKNLLPILENEYAKVGYRAHSQLYNSKYWGVPQNRERYFVVGIRDDLPDTFSFPEEQHEYIPRLYTVLDKEVDEKFYISDDKAQTIINEALKRLDSLGSVHATLTPDRVNKRQNGRRAKGENEEMFTLTAQDIHGIVQKREETDDEK